VTKSPQVVISEFWPEHVAHKDVGKHPTVDDLMGYICACGDVLGWPIEDEPEGADDVEPEPAEKLSVRLARQSQEKIDAARAKVEKATADRKAAGEPDPVGDYAKPVTGAFGTYGGQPVDTVAGDVDSPSTPDVPENESVAQQAIPLCVHGVAADVRCPECDPYQVGETVTVGGIEFTKHSENPFPSEPANTCLHGKHYDDQCDACDRGTSDEAQAAHPASGDPWADGERTEAAEIADGSQEEFGVPPKGGDWGPETGAELEPYKAPEPGTGTPILPTDSQELDPLVNRLAPLDPTMPYTPADVELKIVEILGQIEKSELFLRQQLSRLHIATHNYDIRYALALKKSDETNSGKQNAEATLATAAERYEKTEAELLVRALRDAQHNLRSQLSGFQSVARSLGTSMGNTLGVSPSANRVSSTREPEPAPWEYR
jgi:hypothetical protein